MNTKVEREIRPRVCAGLHGTVVEISTTHRKCTIPNVGAALEEIERAGFAVEPLETYYAQGAPKPFVYTFEGRARKR